MATNNRIKPGRLGLSTGKKTVCNPTLGIVWCQIQLPHDYAGANLGYAGWKAHTSFD